MGFAKLCRTKDDYFFRITFKHRGCGGSLAALQTTEAVVPGSNPASLTVNNSEDRQSHCVYCKISGQRVKPPPETKKKKQKKKHSNTSRDKAKIHYSCFTKGGETKSPGLEETTEEG